MRSCVWSITYLLSLQPKVPLSQFTVATGKAKFQLKFLFSIPRSFSFQCFGRSLFYLIPLLLVIHSHQFHFLCSESHIRCNYILVMTKIISHWKNVTRVMTNSLKCEVLKLRIDPFLK